MKRLVVTQRVVTDRHGERRDALDQRWTRLLEDSGYRPVLLPNSVGDLAAFLEGLDVRGAILTGGNSLAHYGGDAPERDAVERRLLEHCTRYGLPVLGVCRGMQFMHHHAGGGLEEVSGHVTPSLGIECHGAHRLVNSYHEQGFRQAMPSFMVWARAADGVVKAMRHEALPWVGVMWHPERNEPVEAADLELLKELFQ